MFHDWYRESKGETFNSSSETNNILHHHMYYLLFFSLCRIASGGWDKRLLVWDIQTGTILV